MCLYLDELYHGQFSWQIGDSIVLLQVPAQNHNETIPS